MNNPEEELSKNQPMVELSQEEIDQIVQQHTQAAEQKQEKSKNLQTVLDPVEKAKQDAELRKDFAEFMQNLPRKIKRNLYPEQKFSNRLMQAQRERNKK